MIVRYNVVALGALFLQEVLDALAAFVVKEVEFWLVSETFQFVANFFRWQEVADVVPRLYQFIGHGSCRS